MITKKTETQTKQIRLVTRNSHPRRPNISANSALSLSQILIQLKRRHGNGRSSLKQGSCGRKISSKSKSPPEADSNCATPKTLPHCR
mmetsp:Transcript_24095/g.49752  ORF Transcript_24095/g.49752 Transcript_24095/m.49752 type:complete len:87 (+) Transcript_24095:450-710(+)